MPQVYGPLELPSGKKIKFRRPTGLDRANVTQAISISQDNLIGGTMKIQGYLAAKVVTEVDGQSPGANYKNLFNDWDDADVQYYQAIYTEMFSMTEEKQQDVKEKAAFLLANSTSTDGSSSQSNVVAP
jgi:hypothetical protein